MIANLNRASFSASVKNQSPRSILINPARWLVNLGNHRLGFSWDMQSARRLICLSNCEKSCQLWNLTTVFEVNFIFISFYDNCKANLLKISLRYKIVGLMSMWLKKKHLLWRRSNIYLQWRGGSMYSISTFIYSEYRRYCCALLDIYKKNSFNISKCIIIYRKT